MEWVKKNWLVSLLLVFAAAVVVGMVVLVFVESDTLGNPTGLGILAFSIAVIAFLVLVLKKPDKIAMIRINLIWLSTLIAILTLVFGNRLIELLMEPPEGRGDTNTIEIVLSSLVGVGIGGLIAIAGQLVQDSGQASNEGKPAETNPENE